MRTFVPTWFYGNSHRND